MASWSDADVGGILPFLIPLGILAAKAAAAGAISGTAGYRTKKAIEAATRKKRVGKGNMRLVKDMFRRSFRVNK